MHIYFNFFGLQIPGYGLMLVTGVILANVIAFYLLHKYQMDTNDFIILEGYVFLGAILGAKGLYLWVSRKEIQWEHFFESDYFNALMQSGFVFYGGIIGGAAVMILAARIHHIPYEKYFQKFIFLIPLVHGFGRIGCYFAGCCYGKAYTGLLAVKFPENSLAPSGVSLFPVQLLESFFLFLLSFVIFIVYKEKETWCSVETYFLTYGILRFVLEFFRDDAQRGYFLAFSTSQWISIFLVIAVGLWKFMRSKKSREQKDLNK